MNMFQLLFMDPHPHTGVLSAGQYDLPQYLHIANFYMHFAIFYMHFIGHIGRRRFYLTDTCL